MQVATTSLNERVTTIIKLLLTFMITAWPMSRPILGNSTGKSHACRKNHSHDSHVPYSSRVFLPQIRTKESMSNSVFSKRARQLSMKVIFDV